MTDTLKSFKASNLLFPWALLRPREEFEPGMHKSVCVCVYACKCYLLPSLFFKRMLPRVVYQPCDILGLSSLIDSIYLYTPPFNLTVLGEDTVFK